MASNSKSRSDTDRFPLSESIYSQIQSTKRDESVQPHPIPPSYADPQELTFEELVAKDEAILKRPLTPEEKQEVARTIKFFHDHKGHEAAHAEMVLILFGSLLVSQIAVTLWKKYHPRSHNMATLFGLWLIPPMIAFRASHTRFMIIWFVFSIANSLIVYRAMESPMKSSTPKLVYWWYSKIYDVCYAIGLIGYVLFLLPIFKIPALFGASFDTEGDIFELGFILLFYGLYFGTLGRDFVERLSDRMATTMGYYSRTGFPQKHLRENMCAICGDTTSSGNSPETSIRLDCKHIYHEFCIRGWTIIGKKDVCPYCKEKVDLKQFQSNPWDTTQQAYLQLLDMVRYILVWNPIVFVVLHYVFRFLHLK